jgi:hypothetical protein
MGAPTNERKLRPLVCYQLILLLREVFSANVRRISQTDGLPAPIVLHELVPLIRWLARLIGFLDSVPGYLLQAEPLRGWDKFTPRCN